MADQATKKNAIPKVLSIQQAAKQLDVSVRTIQKACIRWKLGTRFSIGTLDRVVVMLTPDDVKFLDRNLQRRVGRPTVTTKTAARKSSRARKS